MTGGGGIRADAWQTELGIAARLNPPRRGDTGGDLSRAFRCGRQHQIRGAHRRDLDHEINSIEKRTGEARLILADAAGDRLPVAAEAGVERVAATAGVHRRDKLETGGIGGAMVGARDRHVAGFERLAQTVEHLRLEFRYYVATAING